MVDKKNRGHDFFEEMYGELKHGKPKKKHKKYGKAVFGEKKKKTSKRKIQDLTEGQIFWVENQYLKIYNKKTTHHPGYISFKKKERFILHSGSSKEIGKCYKLVSFVTPAGSIRMHTGYIQIMPVPELTPEKIGKHHGKLKNNDLKGLKESLRSFLKRKNSKKNIKILKLIDNDGDTNG